MGIVVDIFGALVVGGILADAGVPGEVCVGLALACMVFVNLITLLVSPDTEG